MPLRRIFLRSLRIRKRNSSQLVMRLQQTLVEVIRGDRVAAMVVVLQRSWRSYICSSSNIVRPQGMLLRGLIGSPRSRQWTGRIPTMHFRDAGFGAFVSIPFIQMGHSYAYM